MKVLVISPAAVGDTVAAHSLFQLLHQRHPGLTLDVLAPVRHTPLLARMPEVHALIPLPYAPGRLELRQRLNLIRHLRRRSYDWTIVLTRSFGSALAPWLSRIPRRSGYVGALRYGLLNDIRRLDPDRHPRLIERYAALALEEQAPLPVPLPVPRLVPDAQNLRETLLRLGIPAPQRPVLAFAPGAEFGPARRWPVEHYAELALGRLAQGWDVWLFGSERDAELTRDIQRSTGKRCLDLAGRTALGDSIDLLSLTSAVVSGDAEFTHVAAALGRPLVAVYGASDPTFTPPLGKRTRLLFLGLECSPCLAHDCPLGHLRCMYNIMPEQVDQALGELGV